MYRGVAFEENHTSGNCKPDSCSREIQASKVEINFFYANFNLIYAALLLLTIDFTADRIYKRNRGHKFKYGHGTIIV